MIFASTFVLASALVASAANINVIVGDQNGLVFSPTNVVAQLNDTISFQFSSKNHSVTQSTFASPCVPMNGGVDSGFQAVTAGSSSVPAWSITVNDPNTPLWFHCAQKSPANHCHAGMVFAVNPTADKSFAAFQAAAKSSTDGGASAPPASGGTSPTAGGASPATTTGAGAGQTTGGADSGASTTAGSPPSDSTGAPNGAIASRGLSSAGAVSFVSLIAAVAGLML